MVEAPHHIEQERVFKLKTSSTLPERLIINEAFLNQDKKRIDTNNKVKTEMKELRHEIQAYSGKLHDLSK